VSNRFANPPLDLGVVDTSAVVRADAIDTTLVIHRRVLPTCFRRIRLLPTQEHPRVRPNRAKLEPQLPNSSNGLDAGNRCDAPYCFADPLVGGLCAGARRHLQRHDAGRCAGNASGASVMIGEDHHLHLTRVLTQDGVLPDSMGCAVPHRPRKLIDVSCR